MMIQLVSLSLSPLPLLLLPPVLFFMTRGHHSTVGSHSQYIQREEEGDSEKEEVFIAYPVRSDGVRNENLTNLCNSEVF